MLTGLVSNELATHSSTGSFEFAPPGVNERLIGRAAFDLVWAEDVTEDELEVSRRWNAAWQQRAASGGCRVSPTGAASRARNRPCRKEKRAQFVRLRQG